MAQSESETVLTEHHETDNLDPRTDAPARPGTPVHIAPVKAGLATSLGFGHVSGFVALVHPGAFEAAVAKADGEAALEAWRERANARLAAGQRHLEEGMMGRAALYEPIDNRRFREDHRGYDHHEVEKAMLLNPDARLGADGYYEA